MILCNDCGYSWSEGVLISASEDIQNPKHKLLCKECFKEWLEAE